MKVSREGSIFILVMGMVALFDQSLMTFIQEGIYLFVFFVVLKLIARFVSIHGKKEDKEAVTNLASKYNGIPQTTNELDLRSLTHAKTVWKNIPRDLAEDKEAFFNRAIKAEKAVPNFAVATKALYESQKKQGKSVNVNDILRPVDEDEIEDYVSFTKESQRRLFLPS